jgi:murein DD-endopeptidase MepM/ murein hydrolase activator NlpD
MSTSISNGFRHPLGDGNLTEAAPEIDGVADGYFSAQDHAEANTNIVPGTTVYHLGEDWNGSGGGDTDLGDPVFAVSNGQITDVGFDSALGNWIRVRHDLPGGGSVDSLYAHLEFPAARSGGALLVANDFVGIGEQIGQIGKSGDALTAHLHFEMRTDVNAPLDNGYSGIIQAPAGWVDPTDFINAHRSYADSPIRLGMNSKTKCNALDRRCDGTAISAA